MLTQTPYNYHWKQKDKPNTSSYVAGPAVSQLNWCLPNEAYIWEGHSLLPQQHGNWRIRNHRYVCSAVTVASQMKKNGKHNKMFITNIAGNENCIHLNVTKPTRQ